MVIQPSTSFTEQREKTTEEAEIQYILQELDEEHSYELIKRLSFLPISQSQARRLSLSLLHQACTLPSSFKSICGAILLSISSLPTVSHFFASLRDPEDVQLISQSLLAPAFSSAETFWSTLEFSLAQETYSFLPPHPSLLTSDDLDPLLLLLDFLFHHSPPFFSFEIFRKQGMNQQQEKLLATFFFKREMALEQEAAISTMYATSFSYESIERTYFLQRVHEEVMHTVDQKEYSAFIEKIQMLYDQQKIWQEEAKKKMGDLWKDYSGEKHFQAHQQKVVNLLEEDQKLYMESLRIFCEGESSFGIVLAKENIELHNQILQVCENSVALSFIGTLHSGKSQLVEGMVGSPIVPGEFDSSLAIPVRYLHDPSLLEPSMVVPFHQHLNALVRKINVFIEQEGFDNLMKNARLSFHRTALRKFRDGLQFRAQYDGADEILEISKCLNSLFRIIAGRDPGSSLTKCLSLFWSHGIDHFVTVKANFANLPIPPELAKTVKLSLVNLPPINEAAPRELDLERRVFDALNFCHLVNLVTKFLEFQSLHFRHLFKRIARLQYQSFILTSVVLTVDGGISFISGSTESVRESLKEMEKTYPEKQFFLVNERYYLLSKYFLNEINRTGKKPPARDSPFFEWIYQASSGLDEEEKLENYEAQSVDKLRKKSELMIQSSKVREFHQSLMDGTSQCSFYLSANRAIQNSMLIGNKTNELLKKIILNFQREQETPETLVQTCERVFKEVTLTMNQIQEDHKGESSSLQSRVKASMQEDLQEFLQEIEEEEMQVASTQAEELEQKLNDIFEKKKRSLFESLHQKSHEMEVETQAKVIQKAAEEKIFKPLDQIVKRVQLDEGAFFVNHDLPSINLLEENVRLDSKVIGERLWSNLLGENISLDSKVILSAIKTQLASYGEGIILIAASRVERHLSKVFGSLFLSAFRLMNQIKVALREKEMLERRLDEIIKVSKELDACIEALVSCQTKLE